MAIGRVPGATGIQPSIVDAKGDLIVATAADSVSRLAVGSADQVLTVDSSTATGLKWAAIPSSSGPTFRAYRGVSDQTFSQNTWTKVQFNTENWDTDNCFDPTTNYRFTPTKAGYYQFNQLIWIYSESGTSAGAHALYKNGSVHSICAELTGQSQYRANGGDLIYLNGSTDYVEGYVFSANASPKIPTPYSQLNYISAVWVRS